MWPLSVTSCFGYPKMTLTVLISIYPVSRAEYFGQIKAISLLCHQHPRYCALSISRGNVSPVSSEKMPIPRPQGRSMGCLVWVHCLNKVLASFLSCRAQYRAIFGRDMARVYSSMILCMTDPSMSSVRKNCSYLLFSRNYRTRKYIFMFPQNYSVGKWLIRQIVAFT